MFELFAQGDRSLARSEGGLGIGLTLVQSLAEMHGGSVTAASEGPGKGSEFIVRLPAADRRGRGGTASGRDGRRRGRPGGSGCSSSTTTRTRPAGWPGSCELSGHEVRVAHDGPDGPRGRPRAPARVRPPRHRPARHGRLRGGAPSGQEECCKDAVIIAVSGYGQDEDRRRSKEAGFDHHLVKPVDYDALPSLVRRSNHRPR